MRARGWRDLWESISLYIYIDFEDEEGEEEKGMKIEEVS